MTHAHSGWGGKRFKSDLKGAYLSDRNSKNSPYGSVLRAQRNLPVTAVGVVEIIYYLHGVPLKYYSKKLIERYKSAHWGTILHLKSCLKVYYIHITR